MFKNLFNGRITFNYKQIKLALNNKIILMSKTKDEIAEHGKWRCIEVQSLLTRFMDCIEKKLMTKHKLTGKEIATKY